MTKTKIVQENIYMWHSQFKCSIKIFSNLNYLDETVRWMVKTCIKKLYKTFKREINVKFVTHYKSAKILFFTNTKDKTASLSQSSVEYKFTCRDCSCNYIGKKERTLHERTEFFRTLTRRATNKVRFMNTCQLAPIKVT